MRDVDGALDDGWVPRRWENPIEVCNGDWLCDSCVPRFGATAFRRWCLRGNNLLGLSFFAEHCKHCGTSYSLCRSLPVRVKLNETGSHGIDYDVLCGQCRKSLDDNRVLKYVWRHFNHWDHYLRPDTIEWKHVVATWLAEQEKLKRVA